MTDSVGARLRQGRELRGLTLQQASESTKVRAYYLQALENDDYSVIPSAAQARGFLRIYAEFLELELNDLFQPGPPAAALPETDSPPTPKATASPTRRSTVWDNLLGRLVRRPNKEASPPASPDDVVSVATTGQADQALTVPAGTDAKTLRHRKSAGAGGSGTADVKKNAAE